LKRFATFSDPKLPPLDARRFYRDLEPKLACAQRARQRSRTRAIHAKIANRRKDFLHKLSTRLVKAHGAVFVGNVNASALAKTRQAKSVLDAGWSAFRTMLRYKCDDAGVWFAEVDEAFSTQTCSVCNSRAGPKGREGLGIRGWMCSVCGAIHDRDVNAAQNILAAGHRRLAEGILVL
jgi:IS605 OrfB family transposase